MNNNINKDLNNVNKINIMNKKILFLGYGAVAKCVWAYFDYYFEYDISNVFIIDKSYESLYGPKLDILPKSNIIISFIRTFNFEETLSKINFKTGDIVIDLTCISDTYHFVSKCLELGIHYINTSIEDGNDDLYGSSIDLQQRTVIEIFNNFKQNKEPKSNILIEFGQNPGLIQHYVLYALNVLNKLHDKAEGKNKIVDDFSQEQMVRAIRENKVGTILMSEIDGITANSSFKRNKEIQYNTWSVLGLIGEGLDKTELVCGKHNKFVKPQIPKEYFDKRKTLLLKNSTGSGHKVFFLNEYGINSKMNSVCPIPLETNSVNNSNDYTNDYKFKHYNGALIHHGEIFELARLFGKDAPFMSYVYKLNKYTVDSMIDNFGSKIPGKYDDWHDVTIWLSNDYNRCQVFDNIKINNMFGGFDSIGCTLFCGEYQKIEKIYWCGSLLQSNDPNMNKLFTPTIVQVAAGVLSGLSYIIEPNNANKGLLFPCDLDTMYILNKSVPLLGKFFFTEIPAKDFGNDIKFKLDVII